MQQRACQRGLIWGSDGADGPEGVGYSSSVCVRLSSGRVAASSCELQHQEEARAQGVVPLRIRGVGNGHGNEALSRDEGGETEI